MGNKCAQSLFCFFAEIEKVFMSCINECKHLNKSDLILQALSEIFVKMA